MPRVSKIRFKNFEPIDLISKDVFYVEKANFQFENNRISNYKLSEYSIWNQNNNQFEYKKFDFGVTLKFYDNNKFNYLKVYKNMNEIIEEDFDPRRGYMGYYGKSRGKFMLQYFVFGDGGGYMENKEILIYNDSILLLDGIYGSVYVKKVLPKKYLNFKPDW
ncbi:hypothetical protein KRX57_08335 [Weeksellaceae bacterium TAE3-ERU29]|nr:hypothetical protein [Weeksellaceae bacterium TAE3-ERU29]